MIKVYVWDGWGWDRSRTANTYSLKEFEEKLNKKEFDMDNIEIQFIVE